MFLRRIAPGLLATTLLGLFSALAFAHHGWSWYGDHDFTLSGTVVETHFGNPHDRLTIEADGKQWNLVLSPPGRSRRAKFDSDEVDVGDTITAFGHRHRDQQMFEMKTERLKVGESTYDLYPNRL